MTDLFVPVHRVRLANNTVAGADEMVVYETPWTRSRRGGTPCSARPTERLRPRAPGPAERARATVYFGCPRPNAARAGRTHEAVSAMVAARLAMVFALAPGTASAQIFRWLDGDGDIHYSQGIDSVPMPFRANAVIIGYDRTPDPEPPTAAAREGRVKFSPGQPILVAARVNGKDSAQLMVDTGAARTVISPAVLSSLGVSFDNAVRGTLKGVTGEAEIVAVRVESLEVSGMKYGPARRDLA